MHYSTALIFTSITAVLASHGDGTGPGNGNGQGSSMAMSAASSWITGYSLSASTIYPVTGLTVKTKVKGKDDMTTTSVGTYTMAHESAMNSTATAASTSGTKDAAVTSGSTTGSISLSTMASLTATTTGSAAAQVTTNAAANNAWSAAAGFAAIAGLVMA